jgi:hypothetical protein
MSAKSMHISRAKTIRLKATDTLKRVLGLNSKKNKNEVEVEGSLVDNEARNNTKEITFESVDRDDSNTVVDV